jgi:hypothetical protein
VCVIPAILGHAQHCHPWLFAAYGPIPGRKKRRPKASFLSNSIWSNNLRFVTKAFVEFVDLTSRVKNLLFAGIKRVALRADIDTHIISSVSRASSEGVATTAFYVYIGVFWVDICFHVGVTLKFVCYHVFSLKPYIMGQGRKTGREFYPYGADVASAYLGDCCELFAGRIHS